MSPSSRGRGLKCVAQDLDKIPDMSPSSRGRGLKCVAQDLDKIPDMSPSSRGRGLKSRRHPALHRQAVRRPLHEGVD